MSQTYQCIAIDDDPLFLRKMEVYIDEISWLHLTKTFTNPVQGATAIISEKPDLVFLDIEMPYIDGTYLVDWIDPKLKGLERRPLLIIVSSLHVEASDQHPSVAGYVNKSLVKSPEELAERIQAIIN